MKQNIFSNSDDEAKTSRDKKYDNIKKKLQVPKYNLQTDSDRGSSAV